MFLLFIWLHIDTIIMKDGECMIVIENHTPQPIPFRVSIIPLPYIVNAYFFLNNLFLDLENMVYNKDTEDYTCR